MSLSSLSTVFSILRAIWTPVLFLVLFGYLSVRLDRSYEPGELVGYLTYESASKWLSCMLMISCLLLAYRLTVTMGFRLIMLRDGRKRLPEILRTILGIVSRKSG